MKSLRTVVLVFGILLGGCHKEPLPVPATGGPVFYVSCTINSFAVKLQAGKDGYAMEPGFSKDSNNVYVLESSLSDPDCPTCYGLKVMINDHMASMPGESIHIDSALKLGHYLFNDRSLNSTRYSVTLRPELSDDGGTYEWTIAEPNHTPVPHSGYTVAAKFDALTEYTVSLTHVDASGGCSTTHSNLLKLGAGPEVNINAVRTNTSEMKYTFSVQSESPVVSYVWDFGDNTSPYIGPNPPVHEFAPGTGGTIYYTVTLKTTDASNQETISYYQIAAVPDPICMANFDALITPIPNTQAFSKVTVEVHDPSGKIYSSRDFVQPAESSFEIVSIEDYKMSDGGLKTKRFKVLFNCVLRTGSDQINITKGEAILAAGYE
jgi:hypothetical protein